VRFTVAAQDVDETWRNERPAFAKKARGGESGLAARAIRAPGVGADTVVALGEVFGKPASGKGPSYAAASLGTVAPGDHAWRSSARFRAVRAVTTRVRFRRLTAAEIAWYVSIQSPMTRRARTRRGAGAIL
jgi:septum formation protein